MPVDELIRAQMNCEAMLLASADARMAERIVLLWKREFLADNEIPDALNVPPTLWARLKSEGDTPPLFLLGRRLFCRTADLRTWLEAKARAGKPGSKRLRERAAP